MPAKSKAQAKYFGAALARKRKGKAKASDPHMTEAQMEDYAGTKHKGLPTKKQVKK